MILSINIPKNVKDKNRFVFHLCIQNFCSFICKKRSDKFGITWWMCGYMDGWKGKMGQIIGEPFTMKHKECNCFDKSRNTSSYFFLEQVFIKKETSGLLLCPWRNHSGLTKSLWRLVLFLMHREMWFYFQSIRDCREVNVKDVNKAKQIEGVSLVAHLVKNLPAVQETQVRSLGWEDSLEKEMATHSNILAWKNSRTEEPGGLQSMGSQRVGHDWTTNIVFRRVLVTFYLPEDTTEFW